MKRALISVTDKRGIVELARGLTARGFEIVSTGGTARALREAGVTVLDISDVTHFPEMLDGRLKTLHPMVHGGLLGDRRHSDHASQMSEAEIVPIDLIAVNLYAFGETISKPHTMEEAIESIDIGGPAMIRSGAKNWANVTVLVDPDDYEGALAQIDEGAGPSVNLKYAAKAFRHTALYDSTVSRYLTEQADVDPLEAESLTIGFRRIASFRYGENPHQKGTLYGDPLARAQGLTGLVDARQLWGRELSYNNVADADAAWELVADLGSGACAIVKHGNPCGASRSTIPEQSFVLARDGDPVSAFGGVVAIAGPVDGAFAETITRKGSFFDVIVATGFAEEALAIFQNRAGWGQSVRLLEAAMPDAQRRFTTLRTLRGGAIAQESDASASEEWSVVTRKQPTIEERAQAEFAWKVVKHVRSNAIVVCSANQLIGVGAGQMNRVQSVRLALDQAGERAQGAALASDALFPFPDSIDAAASSGIGIVVQPGGSKKDSDVIARADELGVAMIFTGVRHFRH